MNLIDTVTPTDEPTEAAHDIMGRIPVTPRFIIFSSYGNDSIALIQWAYEEGLKDVVVVYSDTKWAARWWKNRVEWLEFWTHSRGFYTDRTSSMGFVELAKQKRAFPTQQFQWCSYILKIEPGSRWLQENDPEAKAVCLVGVRREESQARADFPRVLLNSHSHGGRVMVAPFADFTEEQRNALLVRAGVKPLPHRSMECSPCINSNKDDLKALDEETITSVEALEREMGFGSRLSRNGKPVGTLFRPHRHMGATGIREVIKWAHSPRGKYRPPEGSAYDESVEDEIPAEKDEFTCNNGYCSN